MDEWLISRRPIAMQTHFHFFNYYWQWFGCIFEKFMYDRLINVCKWEYERVNKLNEWYWELMSGARFSYKFSAVQEMLYGNFLRCIFTLLYLLFFVEKEPFQMILLQVYKFSSDLCQLTFVFEIMIHSKRFWALQTPTS